MSIQNLVENEKPSSASTVRNTLTTVTPPVPSFRVSLSDRRLETIVPPEITMDTTPM